MKESPVILVHGVTGSHLVQTYDDSFDTIWSGVQKAYESIWDLELNPSGQVELNPQSLIGVSRIELLAYGELLGRLRQKLKVPSYIFRYDWRLDNALTATRLGEFIERVMLKTAASQVDVVAHSMGTLVLTALLAQRPRLLARLRRVVLAAPPFLGAAEAVRTLVIGQSSILPINSSNLFRKIARSFPSSYQLLPRYGGALRHHRRDYRDENIWEIKFWQRRVRFQGRDRRAYHQRDQLMQQHLLRAKQFQQSEIFDLDSLPSKERKRFLVVYGIGEKTLETIKVLPRNSRGDIINFFKFDHGANFGEGDGTVPVVSATRFGRLPSHEVRLNNQTKWWNPLSWDDALKSGLAGFHGGFLALDKVQSVVIGFLQGFAPKPSWSEPIAE